MQQVFQILKAFISKWPHINKLTCVIYSLVALLEGGTNCFFSIIISRIH